MPRQPVSLHSSEEFRFPHQSSDFAVSMCLLTLIMALALGRLAWDENWLKFVRVLLAFVTYGSVLLVLLRIKVSASRSGVMRSPWCFIVAAAAAELVSGWLRPGGSLRASLWVAPAAALIGVVHWGGLRGWRSLRECIIKRGVKPAAGSA